jgi:hypothetical protein
MKVKFFSDYERSENLLRRFVANYRVYDNDIEFTTTDNYDYAVAFNRSDETIREGAKIITVIQEPSWSEAHQYKTFLTGSDYILVHDADLFERTNGVKLGGKVIETPAYMFYDDRIHHSFFSYTKDIKKQKKLSMIVSALYFSHANYRKRIAVLSKILDSDLDIDIYGRGFNISDPRYKGPIEYKHSALLPYEYSIAIENCNEKNYISEKFVDCTLCSTVPIYNGAPNISDVYDDRYFRTINIDSPRVVDEIREIISEPAPVSAVNREIYFDRYNLYTKLKEIIFND